MSRPRKPIKIVGFTAEIPLKNGIVAIIDLEDVDKASKYGWVLDDTRPNVYVHTMDRERRKTLKLHRYLMDAKEDQIIDHSNGDGLDNRRKNLRFATASQNGANSRKAKNKTSMYKGVHKRDGGKWRAAIRVNGKLINLGSFVDEREAALAYNTAAIAHFGEYAWLNQFPF